LVRIAQKIEIGERNGVKNGEFALDDMLRATINAKDPMDLIKIYKHMTSEQHLFKLIRIKNKINTFLRNVTLNFVYA
jgi:hypothetical protein